MNLTPASPDARTTGRAIRGFQPRRFAMRRCPSGGACSTGTGNRLTSDGTYQYTYDGEGNRTFRFTSSDGVLNSGDTDITAYACDHRNRLASVSHYTTYANYQAGTRDSAAQYTYDWLDRRIGRTIDADGSGAGTPDSYYNVYQGDNAALEIHDSNGLAAGGTGESAPHRQHRWLYGEAMDEVLASENTAAAGNATGTVLWGLGDHEGTIRDITSASGTVVDHRKFDSPGRWRRIAGHSKCLVWLLN